MERAGVFKGARSRGGGPFPKRVADLTSTLHVSRRWSPLGNRLGGRRALSASLLLQRSGSNCCGDVYDRAQMLRVAPRRAGTTRTVGFPAYIWDPQAIRPFVPPEDLHSQKLTPLPGQGSGTTHSHVPTRSISANNPCLRVTRPPSVQGMISVRARRSPLILAGGRRRSPRARPHDRYCCRYRATARAARQIVGEHMAVTSNEEACCRVSAALAPPGLAALASTPTSAVLCYWLGVSGRATAGHPAV